MNPKQFHKCIQQEREMLLNRLAFLNLLDLFFKTDPKDFYDKDEDAIMEPYRSLLLPYAPIAETTAFIDQVQSIHDEKQKRKTKSKSKIKSRTRKNHHAN